MAVIDLAAAELVYPIRHHHGLSFKEFVLRWFRGKKIQYMSSVQALKNVSLHIGEGERVGIIGYNGAGKSTLLRTIAGVYPISAGRRLVCGSICSLFDIALGFEPDGTGIENIYYRLYALGETPRTIRGRIEAIKEFCELGDFLNVPIRCYSAGMMMRLAFSIATSAAPEILLVDEVFATGDIAFKQKAEARMKAFLDVAKIVVMVGHDLAFLKEFCTRVLWLDHGELRLDGHPAEVVAAYTETAKVRVKPAA